MRSLVGLVAFLPGLILLILCIYALYLAIKIMRWYIRKNDIL